MKKYFYADEDKQVGPFTIDELKEQQILSTTLVWTEGMEIWTEASEVEELKEILTVTPPPIQKAQITPPPISTAKVESEKLHKKAVTEERPGKVKKRSSKSLIFGVVIVAAIAIIGFVFKDEIFGGDSSSGSGGSSYSNGSSNNSSNSSYEEQVQSVQEIEENSPTDFLRADGTYRENFLGGKMVINGTITSSATKATFKDPVVQVLFYSKSKTLLGTENYSIYEVIKPNRTVHFELRVKNYSDVHSLGWKVISAKIN